MSRRSIESATRYPQRKRLGAIRGLAVIALSCILAAFWAAIPVQAAAGSGQSASVQPSLFQRVRFDQRLGQRIPLDLNFENEQGQAVPLRSFFGHGPVILTLVYYRCPMLCTQVLDGLVIGLRQTKLELGKDYSVVSVSIDPRETPALAASEHETYVTRFGRPGAETGWHFLTGREPEIKRLANAVGFGYAYDPASHQFAHAAGIMILTQDGVLSQYTYGVRYPERDLRLGLIRASQRRIGSFVDQILLYCCQYNPNTGKYGLLIWHVIQLCGALTVVFLGGLMLLLFRKENYGRQS